MGGEEQWTRESLPQSTLNLPHAPQGGGFTTPTCPAVFHQPAPRAYCVSRSFSKWEFSLHFPASPVSGNWEGDYGLMRRTAQLGRKWVRGTDKAGTPNLSLSPPGTQEATAQPPLELGCEPVTSVPATEAEVPTGAAHPCEVSTPPPPAKAICCGENRLRWQRGLQGPPLLVVVLWQEPARRFWTELPTAWCLEAPPA